MSNVAITGLGLVSALGHDLDATWTRLIAGETGISEIGAWDRGRYRTQVAGEVIGARASPDAPDRCLALAAEAASEALADAGLAGAGMAASVPNSYRRAVAVGTSLGGMLSLQRYHREWLTQGRYRGGLLRLYPLHLVADWLARRFDLLGPRLVLSTACTASTLALARALDVLRADRADCVLAGGVDPLAEFSFAGFNAMQNMSPHACAPFSLPPGLSIGEGAGFLVLEPLERALARGARIHAILAGRAMNADAYHPTSGDPTGESQARLLRAACADAGLRPADLDWVNAHGTGTSGNDPAECRAIHISLEPDADRVPVSSLKGALGHTLGAAGAIEAVLTARAIADSRIPPTANFTEAREGCDLDFVARAARPGRVSAALTQNYAFGGNNCALVLRDREGTSTASAPRVRRRVVVTGIGVVSPIGYCLDDFAAALRSGCHGISVYSRHPGRLRNRLAGELRDFNPSALTSAKTRRLDRFGAITMAACEQAFIAAGHQRATIQSERFGILLGTAFGPVSSCETFHRPVALGEPQKAPPAVFPTTVFNASAGLAAMHLRLKGPNLVSVLGQAAGLDALAQAADLIAMGDADAMLAGGIEELEPATFAGLGAARVVSPYLGRGGAEGCWPFSPHANGPVPGEGGAILVLEERESALARGATPLAEVLGCGASGDAGIRHQRDPTGTGILVAMRGALDAAGVSPQALDLVLSGAAGEPTMDTAELHALAKLLDGTVPTLPLNGLWGFSGASGALSAAAGVVSLARGFVPQLADPGPRSAHAPPWPKVEEAPPQRILVSALAFGGANISVLLGASS